MNTPYDCQMVHHLFNVMETVGLLSETKARSAYIALNRCVAGVHNIGEHKELTTDDYVRIEQFMRVLHDVGLLSEDQIVEETNKVFRAWTLTEGVEV